MSLRPRPEVEDLKVCPHGGMNYAELKALGLSPETLLDFSVSSNPFMPPPGLRKIISTIAIDRYPDSGAAEFRQRLSAKLGLTPEAIIAGSGSMELIRLIALTYFRYGDSVLILEPTFGEYEIAGRIAGAQTIKLRAREADNFAPRIDEAIELIRQYHPKAVFICNPNNPTSKYLSRPEVEAVLPAIGDGLLVLDEAYLTFVEKGWSSIDLISQGNVVILRSMTKDWGLAGLRLGYAIASQDIIANLRRVCPPWNVNVVAQKIGTTCLEQASYLEKSKKKIKEAKKFLIDELFQIGFQPLPSEANFFLMKVGNAQIFRDALLKRDIMVRDCTSFGLPAYIRIAPRTMSECRKLIDTIRKLNGEGRPDE